MDRAKKLPLVAAAIILALGVLRVIYLTQALAALAVILIICSLYAETLHRKVYSRVGVQHSDFVLYALTSYLAAKAIDFRDANFFYFGTPFLRLALYGLAIYFLVRAFRGRPARRR